jgi:hypothetical protein
MNLKHDFFLMGLQKLHKVLLSMLLIVQMFEVGVGNGSGGVGSGDGVIQFEVGYSKLVEKDLGEDKEKFQ